MTDDKQVLKLVSEKEAELHNKVMERDRLNVEIMMLERDVRNLRTMLFRDVLEAQGKRLTAVGLTEAIRTVLRRHGKPMLPADVKIHLRILGFDLGRFKNPAAAVHNTLARMAMAGELIYNQSTKEYAMPMRTLADLK
jgi:hypothetical protein